MMGSLGYRLPFHLYVTGISGLSAALLQASVETNNLRSFAGPASWKDHFRLWFCPRFLGMYRGSHLNI